MKTAIRLLSILVLLPLLALAQEGTSLSSDWIELVKGAKGQTMGVELRDIQPADSEGVRKITLAVPKKSVSNPDDIEEVVVVGRKPEAPERLNVRYQWVRDFDKDNYGLVIYLGEGNYPIRLYMNSQPGFTR